MPLVPEGKIILVRHGETEANRRKCFAESDDIPLTDTGRRQAHELAGRLAREFRPLILCSSEFARAGETSEIIAATLGLQPEIVPGIHERNFGFLRGQPYERMGEAMASDPLYDPERSWQWAPAGGESLDHVRHRAMEALGAVRARHRGKDIVIVCHGAVIQTICAHLSGDWSESLVPANCGMVEIGWDGQFRLSSVRSNEEEAISIVTQPKAAPGDDGVAAKPSPLRPRL